MKALVTTTSFLKPANEAANNKLRSLFDTVVYNETGKPLEGDEILKLVDGCDAYIAGVDKITADVIERMPSSLKVISRYGVGVDGVDLEMAKKKGIVVTNTPGANSTSVCELAFAMMLNLARRVGEMNSAVVNGEWPRTQGIELAGKTLGIAGLGAIGKRLAVRARAFEMNVVAYDPYFDEKFAEENEIGRVELEELYRISDFISLHVPLLPSTKHMINRDTIRIMKDNVIIVNCARGGLVNETDAAQALKSGKIAGIGLDAFETEPPKDSPLIGLPNVIATPHAGAHTNEAVARMGMMAVDNAWAVVSGQPCRYIVNK